MKLAAQSAFITLNLMIVKELDSYLQVLLRHFYYLNIKYGISFTCCTSQACFRGNL